MRLSKLGPHLRVGWCNLSNASGSLSVFDWLCWPKTKTAFLWFQHVFDLCAILKGGEGKVKKKTQVGKKRRGERKKLLHCTDKSVLKITFLPWISHRLQDSPLFSLSLHHILLFHSHISPLCLGFFPVYSIKPIPISVGSLVCSLCPTWHGSCHKAFTRFGLCCLGLTCILHVRVQSRLRRYYGELAYCIERRYYIPH